MTWYTHPHTGAYFTVPPGTSCDLADRLCSECRGARGRVVPCLTHGVLLGVQVSSVAALLAGPAAAKECQHCTAVLCPRCRGCGFEACAQEASGVISEQR